MASFERVDDFGSARQRRGATARARRKQHVFARHLERRFVAREPPVFAKPQSYSGMRVGGTKACDRPLLEKFIPLRKVLLRRARQPHERELVVFSIEKQRIHQVEEIILAPGGVLVPDL